MRIVVVNAGSSSVKLRVVEEDDHVGASTDLGPPAGDLADRLDDFVSKVGHLDGAGHRVVHGGGRFAAPVLIDDRVRADLEGLSEMAPLHNPPALEAIDTLRRLRPELSSVACFDSGFHAGLPAEASSSALPAEWVARWGIRRFGFHGLSCSWATARTAELLGWPPQRHRIVVCHLGAGASVTAVHDGRSMDTTMGFSPLEGLVMATRAGDIDPGAVTWLLRHGVEVDELDDALEHRSGLAALSGVADGDLRTVLERRAEHDFAAQLAVDVYLHRLRAKIAAMAAAMRGLDALVFTGGIGENATTIRSEACDGLGWLGVEIDDDLNGRVVGTDADLSAAHARVRTVVVQAREELVIAAACRRLLATRDAR